MAQRFLTSMERCAECDFRVMEVITMLKRVAEKGVSRTRYMLVDSHWETLRDVQDNMDDFVDNIVKVNKMNDKDSKKMEESARLFEENLESLFRMISSTSNSNVLQKLSLSLKKALLLMAMDRYDGNRQAICNALGLTLTQLEEEIVRCGLNRFDKAA